MPKPTLENSRALTSALKAVPPSASTLSSEYAERKIGANKGSSTKSSAKRRGALKEWSVTRREGLLLALSSVALRLRRDCSSLLSVTIDCCISGNRDSSSNPGDDTSSGSRLSETQLVWLAISAAASRQAALAAIDSSCSPNPLPSALYARPARYRRTPASRRAV